VWEAIALRGKKAIAGLLAPSACLGADAAVLVHLGVTFALLGAAPAGITARGERGAGQVGVEAGLAGQSVIANVAGRGVKHFRRDRHGRSLRRNWDT